MPAPRSHHPSKTAIQWRGYLPFLGLFLIPPVVLLSRYLAGPNGLLVTVFAMPLAVAWLVAVVRRADQIESRLSFAGLNSRRVALQWLEERAKNGAEREKLAAMAVSIDRLDELTDDLGPECRKFLLAEVGARLRRSLRDEDLVVEGDVTDFLVCLSRLRAPQRETIARLVRRVKSTVDAPVQYLGRPVFITTTFGTAASRYLADVAPTALLEAAEFAHERAQAKGFGGTCDHLETRLGPDSGDSELVAEVTRALENGQITAWYQPQLCTDSGEISGFEALARWEHPKRGVVSPGSFLPIIEQAGLSHRLAQVILTHALSAVRAWDRAGLKVPSVGVNFSAKELRSPHLAEHLRWELDRFELSPDRLTIEVLESVISDSHDDAVATNLRAIAAMGCRVDLDDFGTGFTSIINIRRFRVSRIKIDRRLVMGLDKDKDQRDMIAALLAMAEHLNVDTLGEGVETKEEHLLLAQMGCGHVQGFSIARPMPLGDTLTWAADQTSVAVAARDFTISKVGGRIQDG